MQALLWAVAWLSAAAPSAGKADAGSGATAEPKHSEGDPIWEVLGHFDEYPGAVPYQVADELMIHDASLRLAGFTTADPPAAVIDFYRTEFLREKLYLPKGRPPGMPYPGITAFDFRGDLEKSVMAMPGEGGPTRVILSVSPGKGLETKSVEPGGYSPAGLPVYPGAQDLYRTDAKDQGAFSSTTSYRAGADPAKTLDWIRKQLSDKGWTQANEQGEPGGGLRYVRNREMVVVMLLPLSVDATEVTYIYHQ